jgi:hypothetical protein
MAFPHRIIIEWSPEDEAYVAWVEALNAHGLGETPAEALRQVIFSSITIMGADEQDRRAALAKAKLG